MKICLISNLYPPFILGGAEVSVRRTAEELVKRGNDVIVITTSPERRTYVEKVNGVKVYRVKQMNLYSLYHHQEKHFILKPLWHIIDLWNPYSYKTIKDILKKETPDVVHVHNYKGFSLSSFKAVKSLNLPLIFTAHDYSLICMRANLLNSSGEICKKPSKLCEMYNKAQKEMVKNKPDLVLSPSQFVIDKLRLNGLFKGVKTLKVPLGIELNTNEKGNIRNYENLEILYMGTLGEHKGVHVLINAFKNIKNENIRLNIVGKGFYEKKLKDIAKSDNRIIFHGFLEGENLLKMYKKANITVVPSIWYDNSPMVIYESFMGGTPVIGSKIGGIPELIENGYNGFLFEAGNVIELEKILVDLIENPSRLKKLEEGALESVKKYSMENHINKLVEIYESLILEK